MADTQAIHSRRGASGLRFLPIRVKRFDEPASDFVGAGKAAQVFGGDLVSLLKDLNQIVAA